MSFFGVRWFCISPRRPPPSVSHLQKQRYHHSSSSSSCLPDSSTVVTLGREQPCKNHSNKRLENKVQRRKGKKQPYANAVNRNSSQNARWSIGRKRRSLLDRCEASMSQNRHKKENPNGKISLLSAPSAALFPLPVARTWHNVNSSLR